MPGSATVMINDKEWTVDVALSATQLSAGLGGVASIVTNTGMLFDLGSPQTVEVTTEPMLFSIDIIFINEGLEVIDIVQDVAPGYLVTEATPVRYFLEVNAGEAEGIEAGDSVAITDYQYTAPSTISEWMPTITGIAMLGFIGAMMGGMFYSMSGGSGEERRQLTGRTPPVCSKCGALIYRTGERYYDTPEGTFCYHCVPKIYKVPEYEKIYKPAGKKEHYSSHSLERRYGEPKTEERREAHLKKYGTEKVPERGKGQGGFEVEWQDWSGNWRHWATLWNKEAAEAEAMEARKHLPDREVRVRSISGSSSNPAKEYKVHFIGACKVVDGLCHTHGYSVSREVRCPDSELTQAEWEAAWDLAYGAFPEGQSNPWVNGWWPKTIDEAEKAATSYRRKMMEAAERYAKKMHLAIETYRRAADKASYNYRRYVMREYERGKEISVATVPSEHHSMWLTPEQRDECERLYGAVACRWAEEVAPLGDFDMVKRAAKVFYEKLTKAFGTEATVR